MACLLSFTNQLHPLYDWQQDLLIPPPPPPLLLDPQNLCMTEFGGIDRKGSIPRCSRFFKLPDLALGYAIFRSISREDERIEHLSRWVTNPGESPSNLPAPVTPLSCHPRGPLASACPHSSAKQEQWGIKEKCIILHYVGLGSTKDTSIVY